MPITTITTPPSRTAGLSQDAFSAAMESTLNTMKQAVDDINANASQYNVATTGTSTSSVLIGTGSKTFTTQSGLGFVVGMTLRIANSSTNFMTGEVTSYSGTSLVMNITSVGGSGTLASWTISMAAVGASTAATVSNTPAGNIAATTVQAAINELDSEKLSSAAGAVTGTNLEDITTAETVGSQFVIPVITKDVNGRIPTITTAQKVSQGTAITTTSGTLHQFTSLPSGFKEITVNISGISTSGTSVPIIQLSQSATFATSGYLGSSFTGTGAAQHSSGIQLDNGTGAETYVRHGSITFRNVTGNTWAYSGVIGYSNTARATYIAGSIALSGTLDGVRLTTVNGTDTFDAGSFNYTGV